jgi:O-antigen/teichoic acid export membrane protein
MIPRPGPAFVLMMGRGMGVAASFLIPVVLARELAPSEFGTYKQLFLIHGTLYGIAQMGLAETLFYFVPSSPREAGRHAANAMLGLAASGAACLAFLWAARGGLARWLGNADLAGFLPLLGLHLALMLAAAGLEIVLTARRRFAAAATTYALSDMARTALFLLPVALALGLRGLLAGAVAFAALRFGAALLQAAGEFRDGLRPDWPLLRRQLAYALPFELAVLVDVAQANYHHYAVAHRFDPVTFAVYAVGCLQVPLVDLIAGSACNVMMVRMAEQRRDGRAAALLATWHDTTRKLAAVFVPLVGVLLVTSRDLVTLLFTDAYRDSVPIFMIWTTTFLLAALPLDGLLRVFADTRSFLAISLLKLAFIAVTIGWLLSRLGLRGAAIATVGAAVVAKGAGLLRMKRLMGLGVADLLPWGRLASLAGCGALAAVPALLVGAAGSIPSPLRLAATGLVYIAAYGALLLGARVRRSERVPRGAALRPERAAGAAEGP